MSKQRTICVEPLQLRVYNVRIGPEPPVLPNMNVSLDLNTQGISSKENIWLHIKISTTKNKISVAGLNLVLNSGGKT